VIECVLSKREALHSIPRKGGREGGREEGEEERRREGGEGREREMCPLHLRKWR
jgi:hypothetical protein